MRSSALTAIIVPSYNEKQNILTLIAGIRQTLPQARIFIVDDNSPDQTAQLVRKAKRQDELLFLISQKSKQGRGKAVMTGFKHALAQEAFDILIEMDADLSHQPAELPRLIASVFSHQIAIASRYLPTSQIINWPWQRRFFSWLANHSFKIMMPFKLHDYTNGFRAYSANAVKTLLAQKMISHSYLVLSETAWILAQEGFKFKELPTIFINRHQGKSKTNIKEIGNNLFDLLSLFYQKKFAPTK